MASSSVQCTYRGCSEVFTSEKDMKNHKYYDPKHHYCRKCDYDAADWNDMLDHKIAAMAPFLIGDLRDAKGQRKTHLCCEFCGEDFKSSQGRMDHRREMHQGDQSIVCSGNGPIWDAVSDEMVDGRCGQVFMSASLLIQHYERGQCQFITASHFHAERQHKHVLKQILKNPELFCFNISDSKAMSTDEAESTASVAETMSDVFSVLSLDGGVALLDLDDEEGRTSIPPLQPSSSGDSSHLDQVIDDRSGPQQKSTSGPWPRPLSGVEVQQLRDEARRMAGEPPEGLPTIPTPSPDLPMDVSESSCASHAGSSARHGLRPLPKPKFGGPIPATVEDCVASEMADDGSDAASVSSDATIRPDTASVSQAKSIGSKTTSLSSYITRGRGTLTHEVDWKRLFELKRSGSSKTSDSASTPNPFDATGAHAAYSLFHTRWYDPHSDDYNPDIFFHPILEVYKCPFAQCKETFNLHVEMETHLRYQHVVTKNTCPSCLKTFDRVSDLIRHFEASLRGSRCWIANAVDFAKILDDVTGGFVDVIRNPSSERLIGARRVPGEEGALTIRRVGKGDGVREMLFEGSLPPTLAGENAVEEYARAGAENGSSQESEVVW
ncbi:hypothetical protein ANO11243_069310 [Dothideomycetidae sp. 11243]|nr:hypothetical protein ANO11243_069310 [fungal sp. No.11243]